MNEKSDSMRTVLDCAQRHAHPPGSQGWTGTSLRASLISYSE